MLEGLLNAGCAVTGTWPMRTEQAGGLRELGRNSLASSIMLVCRPRPENAGITDRRGFLGALKAELPAALRDLQQGSIAPVDLAQAAIGPGMAVFSRFAKVVEPSGEPMRVRIALGLVNQVLDEVLAEQEGEFDADTRWAIKWFEQFGLDEGPYGQAEVLATATNTSIGGLREAGILQARAGKVWLLGRKDLPSDWNPTADRRTPVWEVAQHLVKRLEESGEQSAAELLRGVGGLGDVARDLAYRLFAVCERKKWTQEGLAFNSLVVSWPEIARRAGVAPMPDAPVQQTLA
jgi:putative DNA methylase